MNAENEWNARRIDKVMGVVGVLEKYNVAETIADWRDHAIAFIRKTPSAREKMKFKDEDDRILFLCVVLWQISASAIPAITSASCSTSVSA
jgi:hypothetical protein